MKERTSIIAVILFLTVSCLPSRAQVMSAGTFHSYKGVGVIMLAATSDDREFNSFTLYADMSEVFAGRSSRPGAKFNFSRNIMILDIEPQDKEDFCLFAGAGVSAGWVQDYGRQGFGVAAALSGSFGANLAFPERHILITVAATLEAGPWIHKDKGEYNMFLYRSGIYQGIYPHISISYLFR